MPYVMPAVAGALGVAEGTLAYAMLQIGGSLVLSAASKALMPKPDGGVQGRTVTLRQPVAPRHMVYGRVRKGGTIIYANTRTGGNGAVNNDLDVIVVLAGHRVKSIGAVYFDGEMAFDANGVPQGKYAGSTSLEKKLGSETTPTFNVLRSWSPGLWTSAHTLTGCAAIRVSFASNVDVYPNGLPNITVDMEGKDNILDPRTGAKGYSENSALCTADYVAHQHYGLNAQIGAEDGINAGQLIAAANICDEVVARAGGGTERRYTTNGVIVLDQSPKTIIEAMLSAMAGRAVWQAGQWFIQPGAYIPPVLSLTADDVVGNGLTLQTRISQAENFNAVRGQFVSPENDWQADDFPAYRSGVYLAEDGGEERWDDITLPFTISSSAAQRLAKIRLERQRRQMSVMMTGKLATWRAAVGDVVNLDYARWGMAQKPFEISKMALGLQGGEEPYLAPEILLRETSPLVYDWSASEEQIYAAAPRTTLPSVFDIEAPSGLRVTEALYPTLDGGGVKTRVTLMWTASPSAFVDQYQVEASGDGGLTWTVLGRTPQLAFDVLDWRPGQWSWRVKAIAAIGVSSAYEAVKQEIYGRSAKPAALTGVTLQSAGGLAIIKWTRHPDLDVRIGGNIVIRHSTAATPAWTASYSMDRVAGDASLAAVPLKPGTYILRAEDSSGILSDPVLVRTDGIQAVPFAAVDLLQADPVFAGAKTDVFVDANGLLQLDGSVRIDDWPLIDTVTGIDYYGGIGTSQAVNLLTETENLADADWVKSEVTIGAGAIAAPLGSGTADRVVASTLNAQHRIYQLPVWRSTTTYSLSVYARAAGYDWLSINIFGGSASAAAWVNVATGAVGTVNGGAAVAVEDVGGGWFRILYTRTTDDTGAPNLRFYVCNQDGGTVFAGDGTSGLYLWGAQLEIGPAATGYVENGAVISVAGEYRFVSGVDLGLVKNVRLRSEIDVTASAVFQAIDSRPGLIDDWRLIDGAEGSEIDVVMESRTTSDDPAGAPVWSDWSRVDNTEIATRAVEARARLISHDPGVTPLVSKLRLHVDEVA